MLRLLLPLLLLLVASAEKDDNLLLRKYTHSRVVKTRLADEGLPELAALLEELEMGAYLDTFYSKSIDETHAAFKLKDMDLRLMGCSKDEIKRFKARIEELKTVEEIRVEELDPLLVERNALSYGRLFLDGSVSSYEYFLASFGAPPPLIDAKLVWAEPRDGCGIDPAAAGDLSGHFLLMERGGCSFVEKANNGSNVNAAAVVIINDDENLFRVAATLGTQVQEEVKGPDNTATILVRESVKLNLDKALEWQDASATRARIMPLQCGSGRAICLPLLPEERDMELQVDSGVLETQGGPQEAVRAEFMAATFGSVLPRGPVLLTIADPPDACTPLKNEDEVYASVVMVRRGKCSFGDKALNVQKAEGRAILFMDNVAAAGSGVAAQFTALQNIGAPDEQARTLFIPGMFITGAAGERLTHAVKAAEGPGLVMSVVGDNSLADAWLALASVAWDADELEQRALVRQLKDRHKDRPDVVQWVQDKWGLLRPDAAVGDTAAPAAEAAAKEEL